VRKSYQTNSEKANLFTAAFGQYEEREIERALAPPPIE